MRKIIDRGEPGCYVPDEDILLLVDPVTAIEMKRVNKQDGDVEVVELETLTPDGANRVAKKLVGLLGAEGKVGQIPEAIDQTTAYLHERAGEVIPVQISALADCDRLAKIGSFLSDVTARMAPTSSVTSQNI